MTMNPAQSALAAYERLVFQYGTAAANDAAIVAAFLNAAHVVNARRDALLAMVTAAAEKRQPKANTDKPDNVDAEESPS